MKGIRALITCTTAICLSLSAGAALADLQVLGGLAVRWPRMPWD